MIFFPGVGFFEQKTLATCRSKIILRVLILHLLPCGLTLKGAVSGKCKTLVRSVTGLFLCKPSPKHFDIFNKVFRYHFKKKKCNLVLWDFLSLRKNQDCKTFLLVKVITKIIILNTHQRSLNHMSCTLPGATTNMEAAFILKCTRSLLPRYSKADAIWVTIWIELNTDMAQCDLASRMFPYLAKSVTCRQNITTINKEKLTIITCLFSFVMIFELITTGYNRAASE